jgi:hypothetical protein
VPLHLSDVKMLAFQPMTNDKIKIPAFSGHTVPGFAFIPRHYCLAPSHFSYCVNFGSLFWIHIIIYP